MLTVTENGKGRRSDIDTYRITARGGKGIRNYDASKDINTELKNSLNVVRKQASTDLLFPICLMKKVMKSRNIPKNTVYIR